MKTILLVGILIVTGFLPANGQAQATIDTLHSPYLILVNRQSNQQIKELHVGNWVKLKLTDATKIKGIIMHIDTNSFIVSNKQVRFDEIMKMSTRKSWVQGVGIGLIVAGSFWAGLGSAASTSLYGWYGVEESPDEFVIPGMIAMGAGVIMAFPNYRDFGKHRLIVMGSSQKPLVSQLTGDK